MSTIEAPTERGTVDGLALIKSIQPSTVELLKARHRLHRKAVVIALAVGASYWSLIAGPASVLSRIVSGIVLVVALTATATGVFHDANHGSFSTSRRLNRFVGYSGDLLGGSSWIWRFKHNYLHHGNTNIAGFDADIDQAPFARLTPHQPWRRWHRYQHLYMWILYGFLTLQWFLISDFADLRNGGISGHRFPRKPRRRDIVALAVGKVLHVGWALALPFVYHRWWIVLTCYLAISWGVGLGLATMFQLAHCTELAEFPPEDTSHRGSDFVWHQLSTTVDVHARTRLGAQLLHWLMGGLDYQVEHHLAPGLPHTVYPLVANRLSQVCADNDVAVQSHPSPWRAICSHARWLRLMGQPPANG